MKKLFKKYFVPHKGNAYSPHLLRELSVFGLLILISGVYILAQYGGIFITRTPAGAAIYASFLVDMTNQNRVASGESTLTVSPLLTEAAQLKANDMAKNSYFAHTSPTGLTPWHWFDSVGYQFTYAGENLAIDFTDSGTVEQAWMNSPDHRANILNDKFTEIGIATAQGEWQGHETTFVVQEFGQPYIPVGPQPQKLISTPTKVVALNTPAQSNSLIAVRNTNPEVLAASEHTLISSQKAPVTSTDNQLVPPTPFHIFGTFVFSYSQNFINWTYLVLALIIALVTLLTLFIEKKNRQAKHIVYGLVLLSILGIIMYTHTSFSLPPSVI